MSALRELRKARGLTQRALGELAGVSEWTVQQAETGRHSPVITTRRKLCRALGLPIERNVEVFGPWPQLGRRPKAA